LIIGACKTTPGAGTMSRGNTASPTTQSLQCIRMDHRRPWSAFTPTSSGTQCGVRRVS
jgi:hypothetical protein